MVEAKKLFRVKVIELGADLYARPILLQCTSSAWTLGRTAQSGEYKGESGAVHHHGNEMI